MSSCLSGGGRPYRIDIDIVKSPSTSTQTSHSSSPFSTLSESINSPLAISTRKPRAPRKRPNQTYNEAVSLLSTVCPNIFSIKNLKTPSKSTMILGSFDDEFSEFLPPSPTFGVEFFLHQQILNKPMFLSDLKPMNSTEKPCQGPNCDSQLTSSSSPRTPSNLEFLQQPIQDDSSQKSCESPNCDSQLTSWSPCDTYDEDLDTESILDEEIEDGIDSIMGSLTMNNDSCEDSNSPCYNRQTNPYSWNPMGLGFGGKFDFGFGMGREVKGALRQVDDGDWWRYPTVDILDIWPKLKKPPREKKKKKVKRLEEMNFEPSKETFNSISSSSANPSLNSALCLKLNYKEVLNVWSDRGSPFSDDIQGAEPSESDAIGRFCLKVRGPAQNDQEMRSGENRVSVVKSSFWPF